MAVTFLTNKDVSPRNLLDNSDFCNPVNQRGLIQYKGIRYGIDRWYLWHEKGYNGWMVSLNDGCIKVSDNPDSTSQTVNMLRQDIAVDPRLRGKTVTFVAKLKGNWMCRLNINNVNAYIGQYTAYKDAAGTPYSDEEWHIRSWQGVIPEDADTFFVGLQSKPWTDPNDSTNKIICPYYCEWVALYEGAYTDGNFYVLKDDSGKEYYGQLGPNNLPEYRPKGYAAEHLECQRYYVDFGEMTFRSAVSKITADGVAYNVINIPFPVPMRVYPTITNATAVEGTIPELPDVLPTGISYFSVGERYILRYVSASADFPIP